MADGRCDHPQCPSAHWWQKHSNCLSEALWEQSGWADEEGGNSTEWFGYAMLFLFRESATIPAREWSGGFTMNIAPGNFIMLIERSSGAVNFHAYETATDASNAYDEFIREYDIWASADMEMMGEAL